MRRSIDSAIIKFEEWLEFFEPFAQIDRCNTWKDSRGDVMRKIEIVVALAFGLVCCGQTSFAADTSDSAPSTAVPSPTTNGTGGGWQGRGRMRGAGKGGGMQGQGGGGHHAFFKEALSLQSLTADQRTKIQAIADNLKQEGKALRAAAEAANAGGAASGAGAGGGAGRGEFRQKRKAAEQQARALLTPAQLKELDAQSTAGRTSCAQRGSSGKR